MALLLLGSVVLAGLGAWAAAGAATRSVGVRAWAAVVWAGAPALLLALGDGRLGAVLAHVALPWVALGLARAVGVQRVDQVLSGVATAQRARGRRRRGRASRRPPVRGTPTVPTPRVSAEAAAPAGPGPSRRSGSGAPTPPAPSPRPPPRRIAFALVVAGAPSLLVPGLLALCVVAPVRPAPSRPGAARRGAGARPARADDRRGRRARPGGLAAARRRSRPAERVAGRRPGEPAARPPDGRLVARPRRAAADVAAVWPLALGAVVLVLAALALLRGAPVARAVRGAWLVAVLGLATATVVVAVPVAVSDGVVAHGWAGPALSLAGAGLLTAAVLGADRLRERLAAYTFGWRQPVVAAPDRRRGRGARGLARLVDVAGAQRRRRRAARGRARDRARGRPAGAGLRAVVAGARGEHRARRRRRGDGGRR